MKTFTIVQLIIIQLLAVPTLSLVSKTGPKTGPTPSKPPPQTPTSTVSDSSVSLPPSPTVSILGPPTPTVWSHFASLQTPQTINLGQGYPSTSPPQFCLDSLQETVKSGSRIHQYTKSDGHPPLVEQLCKRYSKHMGEEITEEVSSHAVRGRGDGRRLGGNVCAKRDRPDIPLFTEVDRHRRPIDTKSNFKF